MSEEVGDILVDIRDEDLPKLAKMYEKYKESAPHAYSTITNGIEWKKSKNAKSMTFMSPNNCWKDDGTFFLLLECHCFDFFIFTLDETGKNVYEAIKKTKRLDTDFADKPRFLYSIHNSLYPAVERALQERNIEIIEASECYLYAISKDEALKFEIECPPEVYIKKLDKRHAVTLNKDWQHRYKNSEKYVEVLIETNGGYGVFLKFNDELVAWGVFSMMGQLSIIQTANDHTKKGYGSLITKYLSKELAKKGHNALGTVQTENKISKVMFEKMGFKSLGRCTYAFF